MAAIILLAIYSILDPARFAFPQCPMKFITNLQCPGCGSQRAMHQLLQGNIFNAFQLNLLFLPALIYAVIGYAGAFFFPATWPVYQRKYYGTKAAYVALGVIVIFWITRNLIE